MRTRIGTVDHKDHEQKVLELTLLALESGVHSGLDVRPRWPARRVLVDSGVLTKLQTIQTKLPAEVGLILTRGYEPATSNLGIARRQFRALGIGIFRLLYPGRHSEVQDIFGSNGHDVDGTHVDVSICVEGRRVRMLPLGVFTPPTWQQRRVHRCASALAEVYAALKSEGFQIHRNATESLQIHGDLILSQEDPIDKI
jgi:hypothetical protein